MKRIVTTAALIGTLLQAAPAPSWEFTALGGTMMPQTKNSLDDQVVYGGELQLTGLGTLFEPELQILQSTDTDYTGTFTGSTKILRGALNVVYDYRNDSAFTPFAKAGLGYESFLDLHQAGNDDSGYLNYGLGFKLALSEMFALKAEAIYTIKTDDTRWDRNLGLLGGITISFGGYERPASEHEEVIAVTTEQPAPPKPQDNDGDGVLNDVDQCPKTPARRVVDAKGCEILPPVHYSFTVDKADIRPDGEAQFKRYGAFIARNNLRAIIMGHTDNSGSETHNAALGNDRAEVVGAIFRYMGVPRNHIRTVSKGATEPIAPNDTAEGRAKNRRVEVKILPALPPKK